MTDEMRVKDFTYYPLTESLCAFRVPTHTGAETYHQCGRVPRQPINGYGFCDRHAQVVREQSTDIGSTNED